MYNKVFSNFQHNADKDDLPWHRGEEYNYYASNQVPSAIERAICKASAHISTFRYETILLMMDKHKMHLKL